MKKIIAAILFLSAAPAFAADPAAKAPPKPPACGKTVEECEKVVAELREQVADVQAAYQGARQQRDAAQASSYDTALTAYVAAQKAARASAPAPAK